MALFKKECNVKTFSEKVMTTLSGLNIVVDMQDHRTELDMMAATNWKQEKKRRGKRSENVVFHHTAMGLGAEFALSYTRLFKSRSPITENAIGLSYVQRKQDMECEDLVLEIKVKNAKYDKWYISNSQAKSVLHSSKLNDLFLIMEYDELGGLKYRYRPRFLIDSDNIGKYIITNIGGYSPYWFAHEYAVKNKHCIDIKDI